MQTWYDSSHFSALDYMWHIPSNDGASLILSESWHHSGSDESSRISRGWRCKRAGKIAMSGSSRHADRSGEDRSESCSQGGTDELSLTLGWDVLLLFKQMLYQTMQQKDAAPKYEVRSRSPHDCTGHVADTQSFWSHQLRVRIEFSSVCTSNQLLEWISIMALITVYLHIS